jgi:hypothetical protein
MSEETTTLFTESPASWNTRYVTEDGFTCQLTLRADNGKDLLERANSALSYLREQGCMPFYGYSRGNGYQNNNKGNEANPNSDYWCPIHNVEMKRWEKNGKSWLSHLIDGEWCYGKEGGNNGS